MATPTTTQQVKLRKFSALRCTCVDRGFERRGGLKENHKINTCFSDFTDDDIGKDQY